MIENIAQYKEIANFLNDESILNYLIEITEKSNIIQTRRKKRIELLTYIKNCYDNIISIINDIINIQRINRTYINIEWQNITFGISKIKNAKEKKIENMNNKQFALYQKVKTVHEEINKNFDNDNHVNPLNVKILILETWEKKTLKLEYLSKKILIESDKYRHWLNKTIQKTY